MIKKQVTLLTMSALLASCAPLAEGPAEEGTFAYEREMCFKTKERAKRVMNSYRPEQVYGLTDESGEWCFLKGRWK